MYLRKGHIERVFVGYKHLTRLRSLCGTHNACGLQLVHQSARTVVTYGESALNHTG